MIFRNFPCSKCVIKVVNQPLNLDISNFRMRLDRRISIFLYYVCMIMGLIIYSLLWKILKDSILDETGPRIFFEARFKTFFIFSVIILILKRTDDQALKYYIWGYIGFGGRRRRLQWFVAPPLQSLYMLGLCNTSWWALIV